MTSASLSFELDDGVDGGAQLQQVVPKLGEAVSHVRPEHLVLPTPCAAWTLRDLLNHVIGGAEMFADAFGGAPLHDISGRMPDRVGDDPLTAFGAAAERFGAATQAPGAMERVLPLPFGAMTVQTFLRFVAFDLIVHTWDVNSVTGEPTEFDDDLLDEVELFARLVLDASPRSEQLCAAATEAPEGASRIERLVALSGRQV